MLCVLLHQLDPDICALPGDDLEPIHLAIYVIDAGKALGAPIFTTPKDLCGSNPRLKMGFIAQIFNAKLGLEKELEITAFCRYVNVVLAGNRKVASLLPLDEFGNDLFVHIGNGILFQELVNTIVPNTIVDDDDLKMGENVGLLDKAHNFKTMFKKAQVVGFEFNDLKDSIYEIACGR